MTKKHKEASPGAGKRLWTPGEAATEEESVAGSLSEAAAQDAGAEQSDKAAEPDKAAEYLEMARRVQADFENYKKRMVRDQTHAIERASERVVREILPVIDDLDRTLAASEAEDAEVAAEHLADAIRLVREKLLAALAKEGVEVVDPAGEPFDPNVAEAMMQIDRDDLDEQTVVEVYQKGYTMHGRLLRAAKVVVSHSPDDG